MWQKENEFEDAVGRYWEEQEDFDARELTSRIVTRGKRVFSARNKAAGLFKRLHDGLSHTTHRGHHAA